MKQILTRLDASGVSKKKLIAIFGAIVIVGVIFLYFENFYNLTHHSKVLIESWAAENDPNKLNEQEQKALNEIILEKEREHKESANSKDLKGNQTATKCWQSEHFQIVEPCSKCDHFSMSSLKACKPTGYKESLNCEKSGPATRSCSKPERVVVKQYWTFQIVSFLMALVFTVIAKRRKRYLDKLATERVRKQLLSG